MQVYVLDASTYRQARIIEGWNSLVWTERYLEPGEFELKTYAIQDTLKYITWYALISLHESREVMVVDHLSIKRTEDGIRELTVKGKTLDAYLLWREVTPNQYGKKFKMARTYTLDEAGAVLMWNSFVNDSGRDALRAINFNKTQRDVIPLSYVTNSTRKATPRTRRWLEAGQLQPQVFKFLDRKNAKFGIRCVRPSQMPYGFDAPIVSVTTTNGNKGIYSEDDSLYIIGRIAFDIYQGYDRTVNQTANKQVVFSHITGHLAAPEYLFSVENYVPNIWVVSEKGNVDVMDPDWDGRGGLYFKIVQVDGGSPGTDETVAEFLQDLPDVGEAALKDYEKVDMVDSEIIDTHPYMYNPHPWSDASLFGKVGYYLGDLVTVRGEYGNAQTMRVMEYTRTEDSTGERGFPGLAVKD